MAEQIIEKIENFGLSKDNRPKTQFGKIGIVGCGKVGQAIALTISKAGIEVVFIEKNDERVNHAIQQIDKELSNMIDHWGMTSGEKKSIITRINGSTDWNKLKDCDLILEAIKSDESDVEIRKETLKKVEEIVDKHTIIATNSTTVMITELVSELKYRERCVSMFFNTANSESKTIEVVDGTYTSVETIENVKKFIKLIGHIPIQVAESPGLISVRIFVTTLNQACEILMEGVSNIEDIDLTMRNGTKAPLGPFELADKIGLDKIVRWMQDLDNEFGNAKYKPSPIIKKLIREQRFGCVCGHGFYGYDDNGNKIQE